MQEMSTSARARLGFYGSGRPFIQLLSNGLVNMSLLACHKLERTDKATVSLILSFVASIPSLSSLFYCARALLLSSLSNSFSLANVGSDILVLGPFFPILSISFDSGHLI